MNENRIEQLMVIRDELLTDPNVPGLIIWKAAKIAKEDDYLNALMVDWMCETDTQLKSHFLKEIIDYTDEMLRKMDRSEVL